jgi:hypothetical protein
MKTKTILTLTSVLLVLLMTVNTQAQIKVGPVAGFNFSDMTGDINSDGMLVGFHLGILVNFGVTDYLMIEPQLLYSTKGAKLSNDDLVLTYVEIPFWIRYQLESGLNINAGPYFGVMTSAKINEESVRDEYKLLDFGLGGGIGYQLAGGLGLTASYQSGIGNIGDVKKTIIGDQPYTAKVSMFKISVSYTFGGRRN